jgi:hypothetical protein
MDLKPGTRVIHQMFGSGVVRAVSGSGPDARITVDFSGSVGQKKLMAGVANLRVAEAGETARPSAAPAPVKSSWYECLEARCNASPGRRPVALSVIDAIRVELAKPQYWTAVRERLRERGFVPRAIDDIAGRVFVHAEGNLRIEISIRHDEMLKSQDAVMAQAMFAELQRWHLGDYQCSPGAARVELQNPLNDEDEVVLVDETPENLPDRAPKRNPVRVQPKGSIRNRPRQRDQY